MTPAITVLLPAYNCATFLKDAVDSILSQTFPDFELLIIEDGSDDATPAILNSFSDDRLRIIHHEQNRGLIYSLNEGLMAAKGKYIARMDADDISLPLRLEKQFHWMEEHPEAAVCGSQIEGVSGKIQLSSMPCDAAEVKASLLFSCCIAHPSVLLRRDVFINQKFLYDPAYVHAEDYELWSRVSVQYPLYNLDVTLLQYRVHEAQVSQQYSLVQKDAIRRCQKIQLERLGLTVTLADLELHAGFSLLQFENSADYLSRVSIWLLHLKSANLKSRIYEPAVFKRVLAKKWYSYCAFQLDNKWPLKRDVLLAGSTWQLLSVWQRIKLFIRIVMR